MKPSSLLLLALGACTAPADKPGDTRPDTPEDTDTDVTGETGETGDTAPASHWNVVLIVADDQPYDTMWAMPQLTARLVPEAVSFDKAYVTVPMCCPMRASLLSGGYYPKDTAMLTNDEPMGGATVFSDTDTLATRLQRAGVATALVGKYFNQYESELAPYVPPGWDAWVASAAGDGGYVQDVVIGSSGPDASAEGVVTDTGGTHYTTFLFEQALGFVDAHADQPFFLYVAPNAPHLSGSPATEDLALYTDYAARGPAWNEEDVSDKPAWIQAREPFSDVEAAALDENARVMLQNLASLDREVVALMDALEARGALDRTLFIYTSDNGYLNGEHRLSQKGLPYQESVHVPLIVRMPRVAGRTDPRLVAVNLDVAATVAEVFGLDAEGEGLSLAGPLGNQALPTRDHVYIENYTLGTPIWAGTVTERYKYVEWGTGETEIYDLAADPYELVNLAAAPPPDASLAAWGTWVDEHRGLAVVTLQLPEAQVGIPYDVQLEHWGGVGPVTWTPNGSLPDGLSVDAGGRISGTPTAEGDHVFAVWARDEAESRWTGRGQAYNRPLRLTVGPEPIAGFAARTSDTEARLTLHARPGVRVQVRASPSRDLDGARVTSDEVIAGPDGRVEVSLTGLRPDRTWYWIAYYDGIPGDRGDIPAPAPR